MSGQPIGVFDSGVGGLTVVKALRERLPGESLLYLGDTARLPYGTKSPRTVRRYTQRNLRFLAQRDVKAIVIACNSASAAMLDGLEAPVPTWGVIEPGARVAASRSRGRLGVIATEATISSGVYPRVLGLLRPDLTVVARACPLFVPLVEEGWEDDEITLAVARRYLSPLLREEIDTLILGCTHYPLLSGTLERVAGPEVQLVDSAVAVSEDVASELASSDLLDRGGAARHRILVTDASPPFTRLARRILGDDVELERVDVIEG